jgi:hypothetical protein
MAGGACILHGVRRRVTADGAFGAPEEEGAKARDGCGGHGLESWMVGRDEAVGEVMSMVYCGSGNAPFLFYAGGEVVGMQVL